MSLELLARLVGGIGLFLLGMRLMNEGLKVAAGRALRTILARSTRTRMRGVASGFLVTSIVQSSSAVGCWCATGRWARWVRRWRASASSSWGSTPCGVPSRP